MTASRTQERLRDAAAAYGQTIQPQDIPELRLPGVDWKPATRARRRLLTTHVLIPLAAGAAVLALVLSLTFADHVFQGTPASSPTSTPGSTLPPSGPPARDMPKYLVMVTTVQGNGYIESSATGKTVAVIPPPVRGLAIEGVAVAPGDHLFFVVCEAPGPNSATVRLEFFGYTLSAAGRPGQPERLPGKPPVVPLPVTGHVVQLAVSPDGRELAWATDEQLFPDSQEASPPPGITVLNVATGASRSWTTWPAGDTVFTALSWAAGDELSYTATLGNARLSGGRVVRHSGSDTSAFLILNTAAPGSALAGDSRVVLGYSHAIPAGSSAPPQAAVVAGVIAPDGGSAYAELVTSGGVTELARISAQTGAIVQVLLRGSQAASSEPGSIDGRYLLFTLGPRRAVTRTARYVCGHLAGLRVPSGPVTRLPQRIYCSTVARTPLLRAAW